MPFVSVIAPVYNKEEYLHQFLESIENQSYDDYEVILVDDGSSDRSPHILDEFAQKSDRCRVIHQKNSGVCAARNNALAVARGEYAYIVDSDDWLELDALKNLCAEAKKTDADVIYGIAVTEKKDSQKAKKVFPHPFVTDDPKTINEIQCALNNNNKIRVDCPDFDMIDSLGGAPWRAMFKLAIVKENDIKYNTNLRTMGEDYLFWQYLYEHVRRVAYIEKPIYHYRVNEMSLSHGYKSNLLEIFEGIFAEEERFLKDCNKGWEHWEAYYYRVLIYVRQATYYYFLNKANQASEEERYNHFKAVMKSEPYRSAIRKVRVNKLEDGKRKLRILMLRFGLYKFYWIWAKRINSKLSATDI